MNYVMTLLDSCDVKSVREMLNESGGIRNEAWRVCSVSTAQLLWNSAPQVLRIARASAASMESMGATGTCAQVEDEDAAPGEDLAGDSIASVTTSTIPC